MLTQERYESILEMLHERGRIKISEIRDELDVSESTARRDICALDECGKLIKVFGGAVPNEMKYLSKEQTVEQKKTLNRDKKSCVGRYAASFVGEGDFVYIDAGTTTESMLHFLLGKKAVFVTNAVGHAMILARAGEKVYLTGGSLKAATEALVGPQTIESLKEYNFAVGFFGTNGITEQEGFTTPDSEEAYVKKIAMKKTQKPFVLCDASKFGKVSSVTFASVDAAVILTDDAPDFYQEWENVRCTEKDA